jgi:pimeloyl-ACP methyl ester carboxylesterase
MRSFYITINEAVKIWVETLGKPAREAILFISGAGAISSFWSERLCQELVRRKFYVIKYDHRDMGYSSKLPYEEHPFDVMDLARDALAILDSLQVAKAHVVGHSMGGFIAQLLAIHYPERVLSLVSASSSTNSPRVPPPPERTWEVFMKNRPTNHFEKDLPGFLKVWEYLNGLAEFDEELAREYTRNLYERQEIAGALGESHARAQAHLNDRSENLRKLRIPTLVLHGKEDYLVDKFGGIQTAESIPDSKLVLRPRMGHMMFNAEIKRRFEDEIMAFFFPVSETEQGSF